MSMKYQLNPTKVNKNRLIRKACNSQASGASRLNQTPDFDSTGSITLGSTYLMNLENSRKLIKINRWKTAIRYGYRIIGNFRCWEKVKFQVLKTWNDTAGVPLLLAVARLAQPLRRFTSSHAACNRR